ncbi:alpha/beta hydrolase [Mycobacterium sp. 4D054]|uniref:alpha/beta hydrolase n=1 Tax=Mycobacterium sp. 4D054 TaxID=3457440 RepID=UPI003FD64133
MGSRWTVLFGTGLVAASMSGAVLVGVPAAWAMPVDGGTGTPSAAETDQGGDTDDAGAVGRLDEVDGADAPEPVDEVEEVEESEPVDETDEPEPAAEPGTDRQGDIENETAGLDRIALGDSGSSALESGPDTGSEASPGTGVADDLETAALVDGTVEPAGENIIETVGADAAEVAELAPAATLDPESDGRAAAATTAVRMSAAAATSPARAPSLLNVVGSLVLNVLVGFIHLIDGPPVLSPNSTVTVRTSRLDLPIGAGRSVQADWYFPETVNESTRLVYFQHGFLASGPMYSHTIARLAERTNAIVVAPSLTSNFFAPDAAWVGGSTMHRAVAELFVGDRTALVESASAAAEYDIGLPNRFVLVGHSAGGTLVTSVAGFLADNGAIEDLAGVVMLDGVEPAGSRLVSDALAKLRGDNDRPIYLISSERYFWSRGGDMADKLRLARPDHFNGVGLVGGLHIDYMEGGNPVVQFGEYVVGGFSLPRNIKAAADITVGWVDDLFSGTTSAGVYGVPGQRIPVATAAGRATAVVLPLGVPARPVWPPLLDALLTAIFDFAGHHLFVYGPLRGYQTSGHPITSHLVAAVGASRH